MITFSRNIGGIGGARWFAISFNNDSMGIELVGMLNGDNLGGGLDSSKRLLAAVASRISSFRI